MADTNSSGSRQDWKQAQLRTESLEQSSIDNGKTRTGEDGEVQEERREFNQSRFPLYPPGPGDRNGWAELIELHPELEPTFCKEGHMLPEMQKTQSDLRRTPHGTPSGVDLRLRAVGNGVVPAVAGRAFRELARELKLEWLFKEQGNTNT